MTADGSPFSFESPRTKILDVANAWRRQYGEKPTDIRWRRVLKKLDALDKTTATPEEVDAIIGNNSWTSEVCSVCQNDCPESGWLTFEAWDDPQVICADCVRAASQALGEQG